MGELDCLFMAQELERAHFAQSWFKQRKIVWGRDIWTWVTGCFAEKTVSKAKENKSFITLAKCLDIMSPLIGKGKICFKRLWAPLNICAECHFNCCGPFVYCLLNHCYHEDPMSSTAPNKTVNCKIWCQVQLLLFGFDVDHLSVFLVRSISTIQLSKQDHCVPH